MSDIAKRLSDELMEVAYFDIAIEKCLTMRATGPHSAWVPAHWEHRVNPLVKRDIPCVGDYSGGTNKRPPRAANSGGPAGTYLGGPT